MSKRYTVMLFDLDGTLIDTHELILASFMHTLERHCPGKYTREDVIRYMGEPLIDQMRRFDPNQADEMVHTYREHNIQHHDEYASAFPGVVDTLRRLSAAGVKLGVVTNKQRKTAEMGLRLLGVDKLMQTVICFGETEKAKPHPDPVLTAMKRLHGKPDRTLMVGDSKYDLMAGKRAGVASALVGWSMHDPAELHALEPDYVLDSPEDLLRLAGISVGGTSPNC